MAAGSKEESFVATLDAVQARSDAANPVQQPKQCTVKPPEPRDRCGALPAPLQEYMDLQQALGAALRAGFLSLAQARYSMGADRVSALQYPTHMHATARVQRVPGVPGDGHLVLAVREPDAPVEAAAAAAATKAAAAAAIADSLPPSAASDSSWTAALPLPAASAPGAAAVPTAAANPPLSSRSSSSSNSTRAGGGGGGVVASEAAAVGEQLQQMRLTAQQSDSIVDQLAAKYGCTSGAGDISPDSLDEGYVEVTKPSKPLNWFGSLVAPSLRDAEGHFTRALELVVQAANAQGRVRRGIEECRAGVAAAGTGAAAEAATAAAAAQPTAADQK